MAVDKSTLLPERFVTVKISLREATLIKLLRKYRYGKILVEKQDGFIVIAEPQEKIIIREEEGFALTENVRQQ